MSTTADDALLRSIARDVFPTSVRLRTAGIRAVKQANDALMNAVADQLHGAGFQSEDGIVDKVRELRLKFQVFLLLIRHRRDRL